MRTVRTFAVAAGLTLLAGCGSGRPPDPGKTAAPPRTYDVDVALCPPASGTGTVRGRACPADVTAAQVAALRTRLEHDDSVTAFRFVDQVMSVELVSIGLGEQTGLEAAATTGAQFVAVLASGQTAAGFAHRYEKLAGVRTVTACRAADACNVILLQRVGALP